MKNHVIRPIDAYEALKKESKAEYAYLLESGAGDKQLARYSFVGVNPIGRIKVYQHKIELLGNTFSKINEGSNDPLKIIQSAFGKIEVVESPQQPRFIGGAVGYFSYDLIRHYLPNLQEKKTGLPLPNAEFLFTKDIVVFDHFTKEIKIICNAIGKNSSELNEDIIETEVRSKDIHEIISMTEKREREFSKLKELDTTTDTSQAEFVKMVKQAKSYIKAGDIFQVVLSKRTEIDSANKPLSTYLSLRELNPSPYLFLLEFGDIALVGSSPEMLLRVEGKNAFTKPIAGTRKRGITEQKDQALADELLQDKKERAEHIMLVDLHRNDLGRVCQYGSIEVPEFMTVNKFSHVQHIVSTVQGKLAPNTSPFDALRSIFPAGTVSGAPKVRAMEIINELEQQKRGVYAGAVGYFSLNGNLDFAITIRTILQKAQKAYVQAGSGIVADSIPEKEWIESENKAAAMIQALSVGG